MHIVAHGHEVALQGAQAEQLRPGACCLIKLLCCCCLPIRSCCPAKAQQMTEFPAVSAGVPA